MGVSTGVNVGVACEANEETRLIAKVVVVATEEAEEEEEEG